MLSTRLNITTFDNIRPNTGITIILVSYHTNYPKGARIKPLLPLQSSTQWFNSSIGTLRMREKVYKALGGIFVVPEQKNEIIRGVHPLLFLGSPFIHPVRRANSDCDIPLASNQY